MLGSGARLRGRLLDAAGAGLAGEELRVQGLEGSAAGHHGRTTSAPDGSFLFDGLPGGLYHASWTRRRGQVEAALRLELVELGPGEERELVLAPRGRARVIGRIESDEPLPELVVVRLHPLLPPGSLDGPAPGRWARRAQAAFAEHGRFELEHVERGRFAAQVQFATADGRPRHGSAEPFEVPEQGTVEIVIRVP